MLKKFTELLNGVQYREFPKGIIKEADENGIVIVSGASDDLCELEGAICDEFGCFDGGTIYLDEEGRLYNQKRTEQAFKYITAKWCEDGEDGFTWTYDTDIPHETFEMYDGEEKYCKGFVFYKKSLRTDGNYNENTEKLLRLIKETPSLPVAAMLDILEQYNKLNAENIALREKFITAVKDVAERIKMAFYYEFEELIPSIMADKIDEIVKEVLK